MIKYNHRASAVPYYLSSSYLLALRRGVSANLSVNSCLPFGVTDRLRPCPRFYPSTFVEYLRSWARLGFFLSIAESSGDLPDVSFAFTSAPCSNSGRATPRPASSELNEAYTTLCSVVFPRSVTASTLAPWSSSRATSRLPKEGAACKGGQRSLRYAFTSAARSGESCTTLTPSWDSYFLHATTCLEVLSLLVSVSTFTPYQKETGCVGIR